MRINSLRSNKNADIAKNLMLSMSVHLTHNPRVVRIGRIGQSGRGRRPLSAGSNQVDIRGLRRVASGHRSGRKTNARSSNGHGPTVDGRVTCATGLTHLRR